MQNLLSEQFSATGETEVQVDDIVLLGLDDEGEGLVQDMDELTTAIGVCETTVATLESLHADIASTQEDGGLTQQAATFACAAANAATAPLGFSMQVPALESFGDEGGRAASTSFTMEGIKETLSKVWNAIKDFVVKYYRKLKDWYNNNLGTAARLEKAAKALEAKADKVKGSPKETNIKIGGAVKQLVKNAATGDIATGAEVGTMLTDLASLVETAAKDKNVSSGAEAVVSEVEAIDLSKDGATITTALGEAITKVNELGGKIVSLYGINDAVTGDTRFTDKDVKSSKELLGGKKVFLETVASTDGRPGAKVAVAVSVQSSEQKPKEIAGDKEVTALNAKEIGTLAVSIQDAAKSIRTASTTYGDREKMVNKMLKSFDKIAKEVDKSSNEETGGAAAVKTVGAFVKQAKKMTDLTSEPITGLNRQALSSAKAALAYGSSSLSNIKEEKK